MPTDPMPELAVDEEPFDLGDLDRWFEELDEDPGYGVPTGDAYEDQDFGPVSRFVHGEISFGLAEWCMRHVAGIDANLAELAEQHAELVDRATRWHAAAAHRLALRRQFFEAALIRYGADYRALDPKHNRTARLPSGEIGSTERAAAVVVTDDDALIAWAKTLGKAKAAVLVRVKEEPVVAEVKKLATIGQAVIGQRVRVTFADQTSRVLDEILGPDDEPSVAVGDVLVVDDAMDDYAVAVADVELIPETREAVVDAKGKAIPGLGVKPGEITFKVRPQL